jgi:folate-binding protein YgfZ
MTDLNTARSAVARQVGFLDRSARVRLDVTGPDRAKFLHNLTTNEVKRLPEGRGCEAFVTSPQGKTLGFVQLLAGENRILLRTDPGGLGPVLPHLQKYGLFDDVACDDRSEQTYEFHLAGPKAEELLNGLGVELPPEGRLNHRSSLIAGRAVLVVRDDPAGFPGLTLIGPLDDAAAVADALRTAGRPLDLIELAPLSFETLRIEAGTPVSGVDVTPENLPQEVGRDDRAISFVKGCYLGQETVARIDALGHVNKLLKGLRIESVADVPAGSKLELDGKAVGSITSIAPSGEPGRMVALGYVRRAQAQAGTVLTVAGTGSAATATVVDLPMTAPECGE